MTNYYKTSYKIYNDSAQDGNLHASFITETTSLHLSSIINCTETTEKIPINIYPLIYKYAHNPQSIYILKYILRGSFVLEIESRYR